MSLHDPATGEPLPDDSIQRILFITNTVHVYQPPPLTSMKGHYAATWTDDPARHIFTARLRVIETSYRNPSPSPAYDSSSAHESGSDTIKTALVLEDPSSGQLFAAAPYTKQSDIQPVVDSARFFALTVRDPQGRRATLGIGFEDRSEAFDLNLALQEANRALGLQSNTSSFNSLNNSSEKGGGNTARDYSLKEGETITVSVGSGTGRRRVKKEEKEKEKDEREGDEKGLQAFALRPPPSATRMRRQSLRDLGFDDGKFGEFA